MSARPTTVPAPAPVSGSSSAPRAPTVPAVGEARPSDKVLGHAFRISLESDKAVHYDYYLETRAGTAFIGKDKETGDKMLVKNKDEYTSPIQKMLKTDGDLIVLTENSVYVISGLTKMKEITGLDM